MNETSLLGIDGEPPAWEEDAAVWVVTVVLGLSALCCCLFVGACCSRRRGAPKRARLHDDVELTSSRDGASDDVKHLATIPEERSGRSENDHL